MRLRIIFGFILLSCVVAFLFLFGVSSHQNTTRKRKEQEMRRRRQNDEMEEETAAAMVKPKANKIRLACVVLTSEATLVGGALATWDAWANKCCSVRFAVR